jgi:hypothetical protein
MNDEVQKPVLFRWPQAAAFGRVIPKTKFYDHGNVRSALREKFVEDIQRITWAYKLADETIHLRGTVPVPEIQIFTVETKGADVSDDVLTAIDKTVYFPVIFEITNGTRARTAAAQKVLGTRTPKIGSYFTSAWQPSDSVRRPLPTALDLAGLYEAVLSVLLPLAARPGEPVSEAADRLDRSRKIQREISALEKKMRAEPQLNRKIELRKQIKQRTAALTELTNPAPSSKD